MRNHSFLLHTALLLLPLTRSAAASAQPDADTTPSVTPSGTEVTLAEILYREGRQLMAEQRYGEAAVKFAESYRLDPATGTLLNLATCREAEGKLASAWIAFSDAMRAARREQRDDRVRFAEERIAAIEPRLSRLTVDVPPAARIADLVVRLDGVAIGPAVYGVPAPIDPGLHRVEASAPGKQPFSREIRIGAQADRETVTIPALEDDPAALAARTPAPVPTPLPPAPMERPVPAGVYIAAGATVLLIGASAVTGALYLDKTDPATEDDEANARRLGWLNAGLWAASALGAGVTLYLYGARPARPLEAGAGVSTWATAHAGGLRFQAGF